MEPTVTDDDGDDGGDGCGNDDGANDDVDDGGDGGDGGGCGSKIFVHIYSLLSLMSSNKRSLSVDPI